MYKCGSGQNKAQTPIHSNSLTIPRMQPLILESRQKPRSAFITVRKSTPQYTGGDSQILSGDFLAIGVIKGGYARKSHSCCFWAYIINPHTNLIQINIYFFFSYQNHHKVNIGAKIQNNWRPRPCMGVDRNWEWTYFLECNTFVFVLPSRRYIFKIWT